VAMMSRSRSGVKMLGELLSADAAYCSATRANSVRRKASRPTPSVSGEIKLAFSAIPCSHGRQSCLQHTIQKLSFPTAAASEKLYGLFCDGRRRRLNHVLMHLSPEGQQGAELIGITSVLCPFNVPG
jgi:hypothetical protein